MISQVTVEESNDFLILNEIKNHYKKNNRVYLEENKDVIKKKLHEKMPNYKKEAANIYKNMIEKLKSQATKEICSPENCIGRRVCAKNCPVNAITMEISEDEFSVPRINLNKYINCDLCRKNYPILKNNNKSKEIKCYAAKNKNMDVLYKSTSGGISSMLTEEVLKNNSVVYGASEKGFEVEHIRIDKILNRIKPVNKTLIVK